jgi:hypothetical protein
MVLFAGPVFTEWYWSVIFVVVACGPPLAFVAFVVDFAVRRLVRPLGLPQRLALAAAVVVGGLGLIFGGFARRADRQFERENRVAVRSFDFTPYQAGELPEPFDQRYVHALGGYLRVLVSGYDTELRQVSAYQQRADAGVRLTDGACDLPGLKGNPTHDFHNPCRERRTPSGRAVFFGLTEHGGIAFALFDGTLVRLEQIDMLPERDVLAYFDALRPVEPVELEFKRG